ncbi:MAG: rhodanese-like domain-containing protein [Lachnospiraceae bacterium]|nr:rhodanese-like domain-containing protein [Lachnospiraceae bacterium]
MIILAISAFALTACAEPETTTDDTNNNNRETITEVNDMANTNAYNQISQEEAKQMMTLDDGHVIVDVRRADEYKEGHIPGAILIPNESISSEQPKELPDLEQIILVYCRSGRRSKEAAEKLANIGYTNVYEFGGIIDWTGDIEK